MTQHIVIISNYLYSLTAEVTSSIFKTVKRVFSVIEEAQKARAEYEVARMLHNEHRGEDFSHILYMVREGRADELVK